MTPKKAYRKAFGNGFHAAIAIAIFLTADSMAEFWDIPSGIFRVVGAIGALVGLYLWVAVPEDWYSNWIKNH